MADGKNVTVTPGKPLSVTNDDRNFGKVIVEKGGKINIFTRADVRIAELIVN